MQIRQSIPPPGGEQTSKSHSILEVVWESESSKGGRGGRRGEERKIYNKIAQLLKGKTTPSILFFSIILSAIALEKREKRDHPHEHRIFYPLVYKVQPITIVANKISRAWFIVVIAFLGVV